MSRGFDNIDKEFIFENFKTPEKIVRNIQTVKNSCDIVVKMTKNVSYPNIKYKPLSLKTKGGFNENCEKNGIFWAKNCMVLLYYHR